MKNNYHSFEELEENKRNSFMNVMISIVLV
jgi:hypothetical protein